MLGYTIIIVNFLFQFEQLIEIVLKYVVNALIAPFQRAVCSAYCNLVHKE